MAKFWFWISKLALRLTSFSLYMWAICDEDNRGVSWVGVHNTLVASIERGSGGLYTEIFGKPYPIVRRDRQE